MNPQAIISALPWLRRLWKMLPPNLRAPVLLIAAAIGVWQYFAGKKAGEERSSSDETAPSARAGASGSGASGS